MGLSISCNAPSTKKADEEHFDMGENTIDAVQVEEIIYSLYLPTDMSQLFEKTGTNFNPGLLISLVNLPQYQDPEQMALVIGAWGVDMSYCKIYGQSQNSAEYYEAIEQLSVKLEIPESIFRSSSEKIELYFENQDSLSIIINNIFTEVNNHFKQNDKDALATI